MDAPKNYFFDESFYQDSLSTNCFSDKKLSYQSYANAFIIPQNTYNAFDCGLAREDGNVIAETAWYTSIWSKGEQVVDLNVQGKNVEDKKVLFLGVFSGIWGHMITDNISRLWFLETEEYKEHFAEYELVYLSIDGFKFISNFTQLLELLGIEADSLHPITELTRFDEVIVPDKCFFVEGGLTRKFTEYGNTFSSLNLESDGFHCYFTEDYRNLINKLRQHGEQSSSLCHSKIYFSCSHYQSNIKLKTFGEKYLEEYFSSKGYVIIHPEEHSFLEQLAILGHCTHFASTIGSCSHNIVFLPDNVEIILIPRAYFLTGYQITLNQVFPLEIHYIDSSLSIAVNSISPWNGPYFLYVSDELSRYFGDEDQERLNWFKRSIRNFGWYYAWWIFFCDPTYKMAPQSYLRHALVEWNRYKYSTILYRAIAKISRKIISIWWKIQS